MHMERTFLRLLAIIGAVAVAGNVAATSPTSPDDELRTILGPSLTAEIEAWDSAFLVSQQDHVAALAKRGDARSLLGAVLVYPRWSRLGPPAGSLPPEVSEWFVRAREAAPDDALLAWLEATNCPVADDVCDRAAALDRLQRIDPDNAAVWRERMRDANDRGDPSRADEHFRQAAQAERYDNYLRPLGKLLVESTDGLAVPAMSDELVTTLEAFTAVTGFPLDPQSILDSQILMLWNQHAAIAAFLPSSNHCLENSQPRGDAARQADCRAVFSKIAKNGGTLLTRNSGVAFMALFTAARPEGQRWRERKRQNQWQQDSYIALAWPTPPAAYFRRVPRIGELAAVEMLLEEAGVPLEPPDDWVPEPLYRGE